MTSIEEMKKRMTANSLSVIADALIVLACLATFIILFVEVLMEPIL